MWPLLIKVCYNEKSQNISAFKLNSVYYYGSMDLKDRVKCPLFNDSNMSLLFSIKIKPEYGDSNMVCSFWTDVEF